LPLAGSWSKHKQTKSSLNIKSKRNKNTFLLLLILEAFISLFLHTGKVNSYDLISLNVFIAETKLAPCLELCLLKNKFNGASGTRDVVHLEKKGIFESFL
jgi:hypothetical protein